DYYNRYRFSSAKQRYLNLPPLQSALPPPPLQHLLHLHFIFAFHFYCYTWYTSSEDTLRKKSLKNVRYLTSTRTINT
ncbi:hypothetical protein OESDEN_19395, partial [Oesophagostomum dentatum]